MGFPRSLEVSDRPSEALFIAAPLGVFESAGRDWTLRKLLQVLEYGTRTYGIDRRIIKHGGYSAECFRLYKKIQDVAIHFSMASPIPPIDATSYSSARFIKLSDGTRGDTCWLPTDLAALESDKDTEFPDFDPSSIPSSRCEILARIGYSDELSVRCLFIGCQNDPHHIPTLSEELADSPVPVVLLLGRFGSLSPSSTPSPPSRRPQNVTGTARSTAPPSPPPRKNPCSRRTTPPPPPPPRRSNPGSISHPAGPVIQSGTSIFSGVAHSSAPAPVREEKAEKPEDLFAFSSDPIIRSAQEILLPASSHDPWLSSEANERIASLTEKPLPKPRHYDGFLMRGSSIGAYEEEQRGTLGFFVRSSSGKLGFVTCFEVLQPPRIPGNFLESLKDLHLDAGLPIVAPGNYDTVIRIAHALQEDVSDIAKLNELVNHYNAVCGNSIAGRLGVDELGWREDWALAIPKVDFNPHDCFSIRDLRKKLGDHFPSAYVCGITVPENGDRRTFVKDGCTTGWTTGNFVTTQARLFLRSTILGISDSLDPFTAPKGEEPLMPEPDEILPSNVVKASVSVYKMKSDVGDSGGSVLTRAQDGKGFLVSAINSARFDWDGRSFLFAIPASVIVRQITEETGEHWFVESRTSEEEEAFLSLE